MIKTKITIVGIVFLFSLTACEEDSYESLLIDQIVGSYEVEEYWLRRHFSAVGSDRNFERSSFNYDTLIIERSDVAYFDIWVWELHDGRRIGASLSDSIPGTFESPYLSGDQSYGPGQFTLKNGVLEFEYQYGENFFGSLDTDTYHVEGSGTKLNL